MISVWEAFDALKFGTEKHQYLHALQPKDGSRKESTLPNLFQIVNLAPCLIAPCLGKPFIPTFFFAVIRLLDHIGPESRLFAMKFSSAETGMGVTSRP